MRKLLVGVVALFVAVMTASPAIAHVTVNPSSMPTGSFAKLAFRVPNESDTASTVKVEIAFPEDTPIAFVSVKPVPGWTYEIAKGKPSKPVEAHGASIEEVVTSITWSGGQVKPGEFQEFEVSAGPLPEKASEVMFKAIQTYDDGEVARWIDPTPASGEEPEHPAPVLNVTAAEPAVAVTADDDDSDAGVFLGGSALALALVGIAIALTRGRGGAKTT